MEPNNHLTDEQLVSLLNQGDRKAFELIYRTYINELFRFARRNISVKEDCEEIIQEVFTSIWARHKEIQMTSIKSYLLGMVKHKVIRYFEHSSIKKRYVEHYELFSSVYHTMNDEAIDNELLQNSIDKRIAELPERYQIAARLRLNESLSNKEIAIRMNVSRKVVDTYIYQAFTHLRTYYQRIPKAQ